MNTLWGDIMGPVLDFSTERKISNTYQELIVADEKKKVNAKKGFSIPRCLLEQCFICIRGATYISEIIYLKNQ